jgi:hypothetical protein
MVFIRTHGSNTGFKKGLSQECDLFIAPVPIGLRNVTRVLKLQIDKSGKEKRHTTGE